MAAVHLTETPILFDTLQSPIYAEHAAQRVNRLVLALFSCKQPSPATPTQWRWQVALASLKFRRPWRETTFGQVRCV